MQKTWKIVLGGIGAIAIGAVGSGVWELLLFPFLIWGSRGFLTLITFGLESIRDGAYVDVAKGFREKSGTTFYNLLLMLFIIMPFFSYIILFMRKGAKRLVLEMAGEAGGDTDKFVLKKERFILRLSFISFIFMVPMITRIFLDIYINTAVTHFNQSVNVISPFVDAREERLIRSEFAQIKSKTDFVALMKKLSTTAENNNVELPRFVAW